MNDTPLQCFGEVLFDRFPDRRAVLGGAPFNVAWHLQAFGASPALVSRVGDDEDGRAVQAAMVAWGLCPAELQRHDALPTGRVEVRIDDDEPSYEIVHPVAWDDIAVPASLPAGGWLYHGSLALRDDRSRAALDRLAAAEDVQIFLDVNLREPWWDRDAVLERVPRARWVKLNEDELDRLAPPGTTMAERARALFPETRLEGVIVTRGAQGARVFTRDGEAVEAPAPEVRALIDTVGAGDAFSSVMILGLRHGWPLRQSVERALDFAAAVCGLRGATVNDPAFYAPFLEAWGLSDAAKD